MNVRECYETMRGDYEDVKRRFLTDARIRRFALLFPEDRSMADLQEAMGNKDCEGAFHAAHTLKRGMPEPGAGRSLQTCGADHGTAARLQDG